MIKDIVRKFIETKCLLTPGDKVLVALSGGADSVALLRVLIDLGYSCICAHCNFHLRGQESDRDEEFVRTLCKQLSVPFEINHFDTVEFARSKGYSIEMAARELRYEWFESVRIKYSATAIAVAHHMEDSVETFLLNMSRGTGINGLKGISPKNGYVIRPLLEVRKCDILDYLDSLKQDYVTDSTNQIDIYKRNKIRLDIIPLFKEINPSFCESVYETSVKLSDVYSIYKNAVSLSLDRIKDNDYSVSISKLLSEISPQTILYEWLSPYGFNSSQIKDIISGINSGSGKIYICKEWKLLRDRNHLILQKNVISAGKECSLKLNYVDVNSEMIDLRNKSMACLDADKLKGDIVLRKWKSGDKFMPYGMKNFKKIRDYLRDRKYSLFDKENVMVVTAGDEIVWIVDERTDERYKIDSDTVKVVIMQVEKL